MCHTNFFPKGIKLSCCVLSRGRGAWPSVCPAWPSHPCLGEAPEAPPWSPGAPLASLKAPDWSPGKPRFTAADPEIREVNWFVPSHPAHLCGGKAGTEWSLRGNATRQLRVPTLDSESWPSCMTWESCQLPWASVPRYLKWNKMYLTDYVR